MRAYSHVWVFTCVCLWHVQSVVNWQKSTSSTNRDIAKTGSVIRPLSPLQTSAQLRPAPTQARCVKCQR